MNSAKNRLEIDEIRPLLAELVLYYQLPVDKVVDVYDRVAVQLSEEAKQTPVWTWRYPHQVHRGNIKEPGQRFMAAIVRHHEKTIKPKKPAEPRTTTYWPDTPEGRANQRKVQKLVDMETRRRALLDAAEGE